MARAIKAVRSQVQGSRDRYPWEVCAALATILVVDDEIYLRRLLEQQLTSGGHAVITAADGVEAIEKLAQNPGIDALLTDHTMPRLTGMELIDYVHKLNPSLPCIIVTGHHDLRLAKTAMRLGADGFVTKPCTRDDLLFELEGALHRRALSEESVRLRLLVPLLERLAMVLANTLETKDEATGEHAARLAENAEVVARKLGLIEEDIEFVRLGACLHDIGKVGVPETLLRSPHRLTEDEWQVMRQHPEIGARLLEPIEAWGKVREIVLHHHERFDGKGYPFGLSGNEIPIGASILCVVDAVDVMLNRRPYKPPRSWDYVLSEIQNNAGSQFHPDVVEAFITSVDLQGKKSPAARPNSVINEVSA